MLLSGLSVVEGAIEVLVTKEVIIAAVWIYLFRLCDDVDASNNNDVANLFSSLAGNFENVVQYNRDNRAFEVLSSMDTSLLVNTVGFLCRCVFYYSRCGHYVFALWFLLSSMFLSVFSSPNLSGRRVDVCHTSTHGVALVRI